MLKRLQALRITYNNRSCKADHNIKLLYATCCEIWQKNVSLRENWPTTNMSHKIAKDALKKTCLDFEKHLYSLKSFNEMLCIREKYPCLYLEYPAKSLPFICVCASKVFSNHLNVCPLLFLLVQSYKKVKTPI